MKTTLNAIGGQRISAGGLGGAGCAAEKRGGSFAGERDGSFTGGRGGGLDVGQGGSSAGDSGRVVGSIEIDDSMEYPAIESFDDMGLSENLLRGIYSYGFERPSAIQQRAIRPMIDMRDTIAQAQSGTGKTATFSIGLLQNIVPTERGCQAIVLAPTRELAVQIEKVVSALGEYLGVSSFAAIGGVGMRACIDRLRAGVHVVVGTPGRALDMLSRGILSTRDLGFFVLDEADEMLSKGFEEQVYNIFQMLPRTTRVALFSATMPPEVLELTKKFMDASAVKILVKRELQTLDGIKQYYVDVGHEDYKFGCLVDLYEQLSITQAMIFVNTRRKVEWLTEQMHARDFTVSAIHADLPQDERSLIVKEFRSGLSRVLITTDVLARGIDVQQVNMVINYDLPSDISNYVHRIGRSGRFGRKGVAINLLGKNDIRTASEIESYYSTNIDELPCDLAMLG